MTETRRWPHSHSLRASPSPQTGCICSSLTKVQLASLPLAPPRPSSSRSHQSTCACGMAGSHRIRQIMLRGLVPFPPGGPPPPSPSPPQPLQFTKMHTQPGRPDGTHPSYATNGYGWPMIRPGGFIGGYVGPYKRPGGGPNSGQCGWQCDSGSVSGTSGYNAGQQTGPVFGWTVNPIDGNWTRTYSNHAGYVATKDSGEIHCWGAKPYGTLGCPHKTCTSDGCKAMELDEWYPKPISFVYSQSSMYCARECHPPASPNLLLPPSIRAL